MASSVIKQKSKTPDTDRHETSDFIKHKLSGIYPTYALAFLLTFITKAIVSNYTTRKFTNTFFEAIPEFLLIQTAGYHDECINSSDWYISAMILAMAITHPILNRKYSLFTKVIAPLAVIFGGGIMYMNFKNFTVVRQYYGFLEAGLLRAVIFISLGCICFEFNNSRKNNTPQKQARLFLTIFEFFSYALPVFLAIKPLDKHRELFCFILLTIGATITFGKKSYFALIKIPFSEKLAKFSLPLFLSQMGTRAIILKLSFLDSYTEKLLLYTFLSFVFAFVLEFTVDFIKKKKKYTRRNLI